MKFDFIIGNPPYDEETIGSARRKPIYNYFMDEAYKIAEKVELITPARFLFDAGQTPKAWNKKMLSDEHFKVVYFESDGERIFPNTEIKGGIAVTYRDAQQRFGRIGTYTSYTDLNSILVKVNKRECNHKRLDEIISSRGNYRLRSEFFDDYPFAVERLGAGTGNMVVSNIFEKLPECFLETEANGYTPVHGRLKNKRIVKFLKTDYLKENPYTNTYNVLVPEANGNGAFVELSTPFVCRPGYIATDTFISIGCYKTEEEANAALKYVKTKFARAMLGVKKATQHNPKSTWSNVPLQDFTSSSDIDWSVSVAEIDRQLYAKYGLDETEIEFIETHVKEMA